MITPNDRINSWNDNMFPTMTLFLYAPWKQLYMPLKEVVFCNSRWALVIMFMNNIYLQCNKHKNVFFALKLGKWSCGIVACIRAFPVVNWVSFIILLFCSTQNQHNFKEVSNINLTAFKTEILHYFPEKLKVNRQIGWI